jgi:hypothetical protein
LKLPLIRQPIIFHLKEVSKVNIAIINKNPMRKRPTVSSKNNKIKTLHPLIIHLNNQTNQVTPAML